MPNKWLNREAGGGGDGEVGVDGNETSGPEGGVLHATKTARVRPQTTLEKYRCIRPRSSEQRHPNASSYLYQRARLHMFAALPAIVERRGWNPDPIDPTNVSLFGRMTTMANQVRDQLITGLTRQMSRAPR